MTQISVCAAGLFGYNLFYIFWDNLSNSIVFIISILHTYIYTSVSSLYHVTVQIFNIKFSIQMNHFLYIC